MFRLPDIVWSGVLGSGITILGVISTNYFFGKRADKQLSQERSENDKDRKMDLRHEDYVSATRELVKGNMLLASLPEKKDANVASLFCDLFVALNKLLLIVDRPTMRCAIDLNKKYGILLIRAQIKLLPLANYRNQMDSHIQIYNTCQLEIQRLLSAMRAYNEAVQKDPAVYNVLQQSFDFQMASAQEADKKRQEIYEEYQKLLMDYMAYIMAELEPLSELQLDLMILLRTDLGLETDAEEMIALLKQQQQLIQAEIFGGFSQFSTSLT